MIQKASISNLIKLKDCIYLIDKNVLKFHPKLKENITIKKNIIPLTSGEKLKTTEELFKILTKLNHLKCLKSTTLVAVGGGSALDLVGFIASIWMRGISWIAVPTTLLAQADTCYGGKTAINFLNRKNIIGSIYPASKILLISDFLNTLPQETIAEGLSEIAKHALLINDKILLKNLSSLVHRDLSKNMPNYKMIYASLKIKKQFVDNDLWEKRNKRIFLNLGHTFAHALEELFPQNFSHGKALWWGLKAEIIMGVKINHITSNPALLLIDSYLKSFTSYEEDKILISKNLKNILKQFYKDKKIKKSNAVTWVTLKQMGHPTLQYKIPPLSFIKLKQFI